MKDRGQSASSLELVHRFVSKYQPTPEVVLLAGSRAQGTARPHSDYDLVFLYGNLPGGAWREMLSFEKADMEIFAHDLSSLSYFCRELERPSGEPALARMIEDCVLVRCESGDLIDAAREIAHTTSSTYLGRVEGCVKTSSPRPESTRLTDSAFLRGLSKA
jgi:hypothetical protein